MVLLDTDVMIDILRGYPPALAWLRSLDDDVIALPGFVLMERFFKMTLYFWSDTVRRFVSSLILESRTLIS